MPLYEFRCKTCKHEFEALCRMGQDLSEILCPDCGGGDLRKLMSLFSGRRSGSDGDGGTSLTSKCGSCRSSHCASCH